MNRDPVLEVPGNGAKFLSTEELDRQNSLKPKAKFTEGLFDAAAPKKAAYTEGLFDAPAKKAKYTEGLFDKPPAKAKYTEGLFGSQSEVKKPSIEINAPKLIAEKLSNASADSGLGGPVGLVTRTIANSKFTEGLFDAPAAPAAPSDPLGSITPAKPNFYETNLKPFLSGMGVNTHPIDMQPPADPKDTALDAFMSKGIEGLSFGGVKLKDYAAAQAAHPIASIAGNLTGDVGALLLTEGALSGTQLPRMAIEAGQLGTKLFPAATRFIPKAIMSGTTFGTKKFINETIAQFQEGKFDLPKIGAEVIKDTVLGSALGAIGGLKTAAVAVTSAAGLGYTSSRMEGASHKDALLSGAIWAIFELVGSHGRNELLRRQAMDYLSKSFGDYARRVHPEITPEEAYAFGKEYVFREAQKVGGVEKIVKDKSQKGVLEFIEQLNQKVRQKMKGVTVDGDPSIGDLPAKETPAKEEPVKTDAIVAAEKVGKVIGIDAETKLPIIDTKALPSDSSDISKEVSIIEAAGGTAVSPIFHGRTGPNDLIGFQVDVGSGEPTTVTLKRSAITPEAVAAKIEAKRAAFKDNPPATIEQPKEALREWQQKVRAEKESKKIVRVPFSLPADVTPEDLGALYNYGDGSDPVMSALTALRTELSAGEPGQRGYREKADGQGGGNEVFGVGSSYPAWFKDKGLSAAPIKKVIDTILSGKKITEKQNEVIQNLFSGFIKEQKEQASYDRAIAEWKKDNESEAAKSGLEGSEIAGVQSEVESETNADLDKAEKSAEESQDPGSIGEPHKQELRGSTDFGYGANAEQSKPAEAAAQSIIPGADAPSHKKQEFGQAREIPNQDESANPLEESANDDTQGKLFDSLEGRDISELTKEADIVANKILQEGVKSKDLGKDQHGRFHALTERGKQIKEEAGNVYGEFVNQVNEGANSRSKPKAEGFGSRSGGGKKEQAEHFESDKNSSKSGQAETSESDIYAKMPKEFGGMEYIKAIEAPELIKLAKELSGNNVELNRRLKAALGRFLHIDGPNGKARIDITDKIFKDSKLVQGILAHEIGHLMDWLPHETLSRGNILGRLSSLLNYRKTLLPGQPGEGTMLTDKDRARLRRAAEQIYKDRQGGQGKFEFTGEEKKDQNLSNQFDPDTILAIWNRVETSDLPAALMEYVKRLDAAGKKDIVRAAMEAKRNGASVTVEGINVFNKTAKSDPQGVYEIYKDLLRQEILKRKLYEEEVIKGELQKLTKWWHPFDEVSQRHPVTGEMSSYLKYRFSSRELYAEFVSVLLNAPAKAKEIAPTAYEAFFNYLGEKDQVLDSLMGVQALIQGDNDALFREREKDIKGMFIKGEQTFRARQLRYEKAKKSWFYKIRNILWDSNNPGLTPRDAIVKAGAKLNPEMDPKYFLEKAGYVQSVVRSHLEMLDNVLQATTDPALKDDIGLYMFAKRITEDRSDIANPLGHNPKTAEAQLEFMKKKDPERYAKIEKLVQTVQDWLKTQIAPLMEDIYTPEQIKLVNESEHYAPFRVIKYMKDYVSAGIMHQTGTLGDIADPFTSLVLKSVSMISASQHNDLRLRFGKFMLQNPEAFEMRKAKITQYPGTFKIENPPDSTMKTLTWRQNGETQAYHVDKYIVDMFERAGHETLANMGGVLDKVLLNNQLFRPLWITFNLGFQGVNFFRDIGRTWKAHPELTLPKVLQFYAKAFPHAVAKVKGKFDPLINEMLKQSALGVTFNDLILDEGAEETELKAQLQRYDIIPQREQKYANLPVLKQMIQFLDGIRFSGDVIETLPKVAGWMALDKLPTEKRSYVIRNYVGTPNYKRGGSAKPLTNSVYLFSNIIKESFRSMAELATDPELRGQYWKKNLQSNVLAKVLMFAAGLGLFGEQLRQMYDKMTEYDKANYIPIPIGMTKDGEVIYVRMPQDEDGRLLGAITWKVLNGIAKKDFENTFQDVFSFGAGQFPNLSPAISMVGKWGAFLSGHVPQDDFRGRPILTDDQAKAGGMEAFEPMALWTANQFGVTRFDIFDRLKDQPMYKKILALTPGINRFIKVTNYGEVEKYNQAKEGEQKKEASARLKAAEDIKNGVLTPDMADTKKQLRSMEKKVAKNEIRAGYDSMAKSIMSATSNGQKLAVLKAGSENYKTSKEFNSYLEGLYDKKAISSKVWALAINEYEKVKD